MIVRPVNGTARENFLKMPIALSRPYLRNESKYDNLPMDYYGAPQMENKIIYPGPAICRPRPLWREIRAYDACFAPISRFLWLTARHNSSK
jgi:hypothetical protein